LDNLDKLSLDALSGIAYEDDSQIAELHLRGTYSS
jgi:Holliday junction resolvase RusA-like endonuclease